RLEYVFKRDDIKDVKILFEGAIKPGDRITAGTMFLKLFVPGDDVGQELKSPIAGVFERVRAVEDPTNPNNWVMAIDLKVEADVKPDWDAVK
ncbi:MAG: hypothetical protein Q7S68_03580, partial [Deltaproteobacteria bacterium]|nr:hypothetical protein [Deltaproteobacteria bacterium]